MNRIHPTKQCFDVIDAFGVTHRIFEHGTVIESIHLSGPNGLTKGLSRFATSNGACVNWVSKGKYLIDGIGEATSSDPSVP